MAVRVIKLSAGVCLALSFMLLFSATAAAAPDPWKDSYRLETVYQYDAALNALKSLSSSNHLVVMRRAWLYYLMGSYSRSVEMYKKALSINGKSLDARLGLLLPLMAQQRWNEVITNGNKVLEVAPWNYHAHVRIMAAEHALKKWGALEKHARAAHERYPADADIAVYLARAYRMQGNMDAARQVYKQVLELIPDHFESQYNSQ